MSFLTLLKEILAIIGRNKRDSHPSAFSGRRNAFFVCPAVRSQSFSTIINRLARFRSLLFFCHVPISSVGKSNCSSFNHNSFRTLAADLDATEAALAALFDAMEAALAADLDATEAALGPDLEANELRLELRLEADLEASEAALGPDLDAKELRVE